MATETQAEPRDAQTFTAEMVDALLSDLALVEVEVVDARGQRCPTALHPIQFELAGPAEWRGGIAQAPDNGILAKTLPVECGVNRVILRSLPQVGKIVLRASADGLKPAMLEFVSTPFAVNAGLAEHGPGRALPPSLARGPTPQGDSVHPTRVPVGIAGTTAGAAPEQAGQAFDDNENTGWKNDGKRATAWIQFTLERPANVNEVVVKLGGWRRKSYPLRITVDGKEAYSGTTPKSLGYVTLPLKPVKGKTVRIALAGAVDDKDGFGLVEVTGRKLPDTAGAAAPGALEVVEVEFYEPLAAPAR